MHRVCFRNGEAITVDGQSLSIMAIVATARHVVPLMLSSRFEIRERFEKSRSLVVSIVEEEKSVYGVSTGFGGSGIKLSFCKYFITI